MSHNGNPNCGCPDLVAVSRAVMALDDEWAVGDSPFDHAMQQLDAIDHFSDRHDGEALMGDYDLDEPSADA